MTDTGTTPILPAGARPGGIRSFLDRLAWLTPANLAFLGPTDLAPYALSMPRVPVYLPNETDAHEQPERLGPEIEWLP